MSNLKKCALFLQTKDSCLNDAGYPCGKYAIEVSEEKLEFEQGKKCRGNLENKDKGKTNKKEEYGEKHELDQQAKKTIAEPKLMSHDEKKKAKETVASLECDTVPNSQLEVYGANYYSLWKKEGQAVNEPKNFDLEENKKEASLEVAFIKNCFKMWEADAKAENEKKNIITASKK